MKYKLLIANILLLIFAGCATIQVAEVSSNSIQKKSEHLIFEDNSIRVAYSFWGNGGVVGFQIFNKLNVPIYLDWKRSSLIFNGRKLDYWMDKSTTETVGYYSSYIYHGAIPFTTLMAEQQGSFNSTSQTTREERITFVPPQSATVKGKFLICSGYYNIKGATKEKGLNILKISLAESNCKFRNYLTYSTNEDMSNEQHVDNEFYVSKIMEMNKSRFERNVKGHLADPDFKLSHTLFYIEAN